MGTDCGNDRAAIRLFPREPQASKPAGRGEQPTRRWFNTARARGHQHAKWDTGDEIKQFGSVTSPAQRASWGLQLSMHSRGTDAWHGVTWSIRAPRLINSTPKPNTTLSITDVVNRAVFRFSDPAILVRRSLKERNSLNLRAILCFVCSVEGCGHNRHPCLAPWCLFKNARSCAS